MIEPLDHYLLRAYLDGEMDEATAQAFEIRLIERPDLAELVDADFALGAGLRAAGVGDAKPAPVANGVVALPARRAARPLAQAGPWLAAAGVALAVGLGAGRMLRPELPQPPALVAATLVQVDKNRSAPGGAIEARIPASGSVVLLVPVAAVDACPVRVEIRQGAGTLAADATTDSFGYANLVVDAARLMPGPAEIEVGCVGGKPAKYAMTFVR
jgi:hypothetical protein